MLKNLKPISLILLAGALSYPVASHAGITPGQPNVDFSQQSEKITGIVEDSFGPVAGASVVVKGTTNGIMTDMNGQFTLESLKNGDIIQISYIGFVTQEVKFTGQTILKITLEEDTQKLDEVVVVGFGTQKKVNLTGSVGIVNAEALESRPVQNGRRTIGIDRRHGGRYQLHKPARHREYFCFERRGSLFHLRFTCTVRGYSGNNQKRKER